MKNDKLGCVVRLLVAFLLLIIALLNIGLLLADDTSMKLIFLFLMVGLTSALIILVIVWLGEEAFSKRLFRLGTRSWNRFRSHMTDVPQQQINARVYVKRFVQLDTANPPAFQYFVSFILETGLVKEFEVDFLVFSYLNEGQYGLLFFREKGQFRYFVTFKPYSQPSSPGT